MRRPDDAVLVALAPVRDALLATALREAAAIRERAEAEAARTRAAAEAEADGIRVRARRRGAEDADAALASERARARHEAHAVVLAARREAYDALRAAAGAAMANVRDDPDYPLVRQHMADAVRRLLGPDAVLSEGTGGGVVGEVAGRRADFSLAGYADRAVDAVAAEAAEQTS
jgi:vacuolar-type H+-ATPase subunit E/Vma4